MAIAYSSRRNKGRMPAASARKMGTWKLAYADFLTALCAFFLIMWIIHGVPKDERQTLATQFGGAQEAQSFAATTPDDLAARLAASLRNDAALNTYGSSVTITAESDRIRIDLSDGAENPLFETGDGRLNESGASLTRLVGQAISILPMPVLVEGHTDAHPSLTRGYSNWELSADRANSARRLLLEAGVSEHRIEGVAGLANTRPLIVDDPKNAANRRISIVLVIHPKTA